MLQLTIIKLKSISFLLLSIVMLAAVFATAASAQSQCTGSQLSVTEGEGESDMGGKRYGVFEFTNKSTEPCTLAGFPSFAALDKAGKVMAVVKVKYTNDYVNSPVEKSDANKVVTLEPGKKASFQIYYNDGMALDHKKPFPKVAKVRIKAPKDTKVFTLKSEFTACCGIQVGSIRSVEIE